MSVRQPFARTTPEAVGIPSKAIEALINNLRVSGIEMHSIMILRHGKVCAEGWWQPYAPDRIHNVHSFTKTFVATAIGILESEGRLSLEDKVISFFPDETPDSPCANLRAMNIHNLLSMSTGHHSEPAIRGEKDFVRAFLAWPVEHAPGTWFTYNSNATHMLSRIVHKVTGQTFVEFLRGRIMDRMGFGDVECMTMADGFPSGGGGFAMTSEDMCRLAQLYLDGGRWNGEQLVPEAWIRAATVPQCDNSNGEHRDGNEDWEAGYGYQLWMNAPAHTYRYDGAFGQEALVCPDQDMAVICTAATTQLPLLLNKVWRFILNNVSPAPLPENPAALAHVRALLDGLRLEELNPGGASWLQARACGQRIALADNDAAPFAINFMRPAAAAPALRAITPTFGGGELTLSIETSGGAIELRAGMDGNARRNAPVIAGEETELFASARWLDQNVLSVSWRTLRRVYSVELRIAYRLNGADVTLNVFPRGGETVIRGEYA